MMRACLPLFDSGRQLSDSIIWWYLHPVDWRGHHHPVNVGYPYPPPTEFKYRWIPNNLHTLSPWFCLKTNVVGCELIPACIRIIKSSVFCKKWWLQQNCGLYPQSNSRHTRDTESWWGMRLPSDVAIRSDLSSISSDDKCGSRVHTWNPSTQTLPGYDKRKTWAPTQPFRSDLDRRTNR